jgi:hypothetical protein
VSKQPSVPQSKQGYSDPWNLDLPPVRPGFIRGLVANIRNSTEECQYGELLILDFDLHAKGGGTIASVQMRGTDFSRHLRHGALVDVPDPDPTVRPIVTKRLYTPREGREALVAYYPGAEGRSRRGERLYGFALVLGGLALVAILLTIWRHFMR